MTKKIINGLVIVGEKSAEEHIASFFPRLKELKPEISWFGVGGKYLENQSVELLYRLEDFSSMGFSEVIKKIFFYKNARDHLLAEVQKRDVKVAILVDFQSFNMNIASHLIKMGVKVFYYVAPQAWAWKEWRVHSLKRSVSYLFSILPFEKQWFENRGLKNIISVPHPLWLKYHHQLREIKSLKNEIVFLPGSRSSEAKLMFPLFLKVIDLMRQDFGSQYRFSVVFSSSLDSKYRDYYSKYFDVIYNDTELSEALIKAKVSVAASGTVTLATGLFKVPTVVCYKVSLLNQFIFHAFINYSGFISLTNLIIGKKVFPELLQDECHELQIVRKLKHWLLEKDNYDATVSDLEYLEGKLNGQLIDVAEFISRKMDEANEY